MEWLEAFFRGLVATLDITQGFDLKVYLAVFLLAIIGEVEIMVPLLLETIWLALGYQGGTNVTAVVNLAVAFLLAQMGRQIGISTIYFLYGAISSPLSRFFKWLLQRSKLYQKYVASDYLYNVRFLSLPSATIAMLTPLNYPVKLMLVVKRKPRILLIGTLLSGMAFDLTYIIIGAIFHVTTLNLAYMPAFLLIGLVLFFILRATVLKPKVPQ